MLFYFFLVLPRSKGSVKIGFNIICAGSALDEWGSTYIRCLPDHRFWCEMSLGKRDRPRQKVYTGQNAKISIYPESRRLHLAEKSRSGNPNPNHSISEILVIPLIQLKLKHFLSAPSYPVTSPNLPVPSEIFTLHLAAPKPSLSLIVTI